MQHFARQEFQSNCTMEPRVLGLVNDTHTAATELFYDTVMRDGLPNKRAGIGHLAQMLGWNSEASQRVELGNTDRELSAPDKRSINRKSDFQISGNATHQD